MIQCFLLPQNSLFYIEKGMENLKSPQNRLTGSWLMYPHDSKSEYVLNDSSQLKKGYKKCMNELMSIPY